MENNKRPVILIVYGYHPKEKFAIKVGEYLAQNKKNHDLLVVGYDGMADSGTSSYHLREFVNRFNPSVSSLILHNDEDMGIDAAIVHNAKSKCEHKLALRPLLKFCFERSAGDNLVVCGRFLTRNNHRSLIDIELSSQTGMEWAANLVLDFSQHLINLYREKGIVL